MFDLSTVLAPVSYSLAQAFDLDPNLVDPNILVEGYAIPNPATLSDPVAQHYAAFLLAAVPPVDAHYQFRKELVRDIYYWWLTGEGDVLLLWGPTGSGKTSVFEQWCARLGIPLFMAKGHRRFDPIEAFGQFVGGEGGTTPWVDGPVTLAARYGLPCIINEYDRIAPDRAVVFNDVFEGRAFPVPGKSGEVVTPQQGYRRVRKVCTAHLIIWSGAKRKGIRDSYYDLGYVEAEWPTEDVIQEFMDMSVRKLDELAQQGKRTRSKKKEVVEEPQAVTMHSAAVMDAGNPPAVMEDDQPETVKLKKFPSVHRGVIQEVGVMKHCKNGNEFDTFGVVYRTHEGIIESVFGANLRHALQQAEAGVGDTVEILKIGRKTIEKGKAPMNLFKVAKLTSST